MKKLVSALSQEALIENQRAVEKTKGYIGQSRRKASLCRQRADVGMSGYIPRHTLNGGSAAHLIKL
jgi:hypothetical protein